MCESSGIFFTFDHRYFRKFMKKKFECGYRIKWEVTKSNFKGKGMVSKRSSALMLDKMRDTQILYNFFK